PGLVPASAAGDAGDRRLAHAGAVILQHEAGLSALRAPRDADAAVGPFAGVVEEVAQNLGEVTLVPGEGEAVGHGDLPAQGLALGQALEGAGDLRDRRG